MDGDPEEAEQVCSLGIERVQSSRLCGEGLPEKDDLRQGIELKIEAFHAPEQKRVISFSPGDPDNPPNWPAVSAPHPPARGDERDESNVAKLTWNAVQEVVYHNCGCPGRHKLHLRIFPPLRRIALHTG